MKRSISIALALVTVLALAGCHHQTSSSTPTPVVSTEQRIAQINQSVATLNQGLIPAVSSLYQAGVITADQAKSISTVQDSVTKATTGVASILSQPGTWADRAIAFQNLALSIVPPSGYKYFGVSTDTQFQALVTGIDTIESTFKIMVNLAQQQALQQAAAPATK